MELRELRTKSVFSFFMLNALFILIVFLLQLNKDQIHVVWPLGVKENITIVKDTDQVTSSKQWPIIGIPFNTISSLIITTTYHYLYLTALLEHHIYYHPTIIPLPTFGERTFLVHLIIPLYTQGQGKENFYMYVTVEIDGA